MILVTDDRTIYFQAASFDMGDRYLNIMIAIVNEAEGAGVIASGSVQDFFCAGELKKELRKDTCMLTNAIERDSGCIRSPHVLLVL